ncbi:hydroxypyruvate isomerase [Methyloprofundus sedimenti]|uniref:Hydroxypyruvate isomerase n=1 Tax=Methyloprofundus sedimenti TaxID=1420851 RepID=A0A1V8M2X0_9GAMM|nr:TIM barrel protein [Methyloprofundus sedimenti]OQK15901.1 hydroxypyruvate isomerase [Methyloprofundus sedimenti]
MLRFSANLSVLFTEVPLQSRFQAAKEQGFNAVEVQFPYELSANTIHQELAKHQLQLVLFNVAADDLLQGGEGLASVPEKQQQFKQSVTEAVAYAKILKPNAINILPGRCLNKTRLAIYQQTFKENLRYAINAFSPLGIKTVFEAINTVDMPDFIIHSSEQMFAIMQEINHPDLLMQYDIYHMLMMQEAPANFITQYADKIGHIQFADCPGRHQPGTGNMDYQQIFSIIQASPYKGWVGAEYKPLSNTLASLNWFKNQE